MLDGMTVLSCATPKIGYKRHSHAGAQVDSRVIGVEVVCGTIDTVFLFVADNMVPGGANLIVEVVRQAQIELARLLNGELPKELICQFDNCGENKVNFGPRITF